MLATPTPNQKMSLVDGIIGLNSLSTSFARWLCSLSHKRQSELPHWLEACFGQWSVGGSGPKRPHYSHLYEERFSHVVWGLDDTWGTSAWSQVQPDLYLHAEPPGWTQSWWAMPRWPADLWASIKNYCFNLLYFGLNYLFYSNKV